MLKYVDEPIKFVSVMPPFETSLGWSTFALSDDVVYGLVFGHSSKSHAQRAAQLSFEGYCKSLTPTSNPPPLGIDLKERILRFADGEPTDFADVNVSMQHLASFSNRVVKACRRIGWGQTLTYGQLAQKCGSPRAARAVGHVMASNRCPLIVPCHRVLAANGRLGGYSAPGGLHTKQRLLHLEQASIMFVGGRKPPL